jgi:pyridoxal phosphate enzyme (YggS family)
MPQTASPFDDNAVQRLEIIHAQIRKAALSNRRDPEGITLVAVSKTFPTSMIVPVLEAGHRIFGENRIQEAKAKWPALREHYPNVMLHLIGPLQSNKARDAVALFEAIHTVDRPKIAVALAEEIARQGRSPTLFVEVNTGGEEQKAGVLPRDADAFIADCRTKYQLAIEGLMCIPPINEPPAPHFALLQKIARQNNLSFLSMGMSADFESAIAFGATHVRVGSAIFGQRQLVRGL